MRLACSFRRPRRKTSYFTFGESKAKVRHGEGALASTRGACAPQHSKTQMNSPSNPESGPGSPPPAITPSDSGVSDPGYNTAAPRPLYWSVWREVWENRSIYIAPLAVAVVVLLRVIISSYGMPGRRCGEVLMDSAKQRALTRQPFGAAARVL